MIPVYSRNRAYAIFFIAYTLIGESGRVCRGHWGKLLGVFPNPVASPLCDHRWPVLSACWAGQVAPHPYTRALGPCPAHSAGLLLTGWARLGPRGPGCCCSSRPCPLPARSSLTIWSLLTMAFPLPRELVSDEPDDGHHLQPVPGLPDGELSCPPARLCLELPLEAWQGAGRRGGPGAGWEGGVCGGLSTAPAPLLRVRGTGPISPLCPPAGAGPTAIPGPFPAPSPLGETARRLKLPGQ